MRFSGVLILSETALSLLALAELAQFAAHRRDLSKRGRIDVGGRHFPAGGVDLALERGEALFELADAPAARVVTSGQRSHLDAARSYAPGHVPSGG
jgi:hypothetical protein